MRTTWEHKHRPYWKVTRILIYGTRRIQGFPHTLEPPKYIIHIHTTCSEQRYILHIHNVLDAKRLILHVHTADAAKIYILHVHTACGAKRYTLHIHSMFILLSLTPLINIHSRLSQRIFEKSRNDPNGILRGPGYTDS
jgi:hypothetical protein